MGESREVVNDIAGGSMWLPRLGAGNTYALGSDDDVGGSNPTRVGQLEGETLRLSVGGVGTCAPQR